MNADIHECARMLIAVSGPESVPKAEQDWLAAHIESCASCREFAENMRETVSALRAVPVTADVRLVSAAQRRVRQRALELQRQQERMWVICVCCVAVTLGTAFTTAALWWGFAWLGQPSEISAPVWQIGFVCLGLMPAIVAGIILLARGTHLADHNGTFSG